MIIDGKVLADTILTRLKSTVTSLKIRGCTPTLAVILVGDNAASLSYIKQKEKAAINIGAKVILEQLPGNVSPTILSSAIAHYNNDASIHGLIIQRPIPEGIGKVGDILSRVAPTKDIDGFIPNSPFEPPVARAVLTILEHVHGHLVGQGLVNNDFIAWLTSQSIAIVGRGETAGKPIADTLKRYNCATFIIHSHTNNPKKVLQNATIIVSCVGKPRIITRSLIQPGVILISLGIWSDQQGKLHGDYEPEEVKSIASFYTPTPGGVGPVNVACLMNNLTDAAIMAVNPISG
jgi:methylenetetrahydrofolate dehydrogenase (NADP+)/methenyltetrahydrofolate cyclohydrolase